MNSTLDTGSSKTNVVASWYINLVQGKLKMISQNRIKAQSGENCAKKNRSLEKKKQICGQEKKYYCNGGRSIEIDSEEGYLENGQIENRKVKDQYALRKFNEWASLWTY